MAAEDLLGEEAALRVEAPEPLVVEIIGNAVGFRLL
jgi:hypothetical protein